MIYEYSFDSVPYHDGIIIIVNIGIIVFETYYFPGNNNK